MWTKTETAVELLRALERKLVLDDSPLSGGEEQKVEDTVGSRQKGDLRKDLGKLIKLLENPAFKNNLAMQASIRSLEEKLMMNSSQIHLDEGNSNSASTHQHQQMDQTSSRNKIDRIKLTLPIGDRRSIDPGWTLIDNEENNTVIVAQVSPRGFMARQAGIEAGDELLAVDDLSVSNGRLSSISINELLASKIDHYSSQSLSPSSSSTAPAATTNTVFHSQQNQQGVGRGGELVLELVVAKAVNCSSSRRRTAVRETTSSSSSSSSKQSWRPAAAESSDNNCTGRSSSFGENSMVLHDEWTQIQVVELENDGSGLGFGIAGGRSTGVIIKTILAGGTADRDGRLRPGDHLLQINDVHLHGMSSEQVVMILRQQDQANVRMVVGRPTDATSPHPSHSSYQQHLENEGKQLDNRGSFTVPTKVASDPLLLDEHFHQMANAAAASNLQKHLVQKDDEHEQRNIATCSGSTATTATVQQHGQEITDLSALAQNTFSKENRHPEEYEFLDVTLRRDPKSGLGIAVACYVHRNEEIAGLFVRNILPGSVSDEDGRVRRHDQIVKVNSNDIDQVKSHKEAIKHLAESGDVVTLTLVRYHPWSSKYRYLEMLAAQDTDRQPVDLHSLNSPTSPPPPVSAHKRAAAPFDDHHHHYDQHDERAAAEEVSKRNKWRSILGDDQEVVIARIHRSIASAGTSQQHFGISLEGTVDVVNGTELRPHHYIRSISPDSAAAACGTLREGDELLEANDRDLYGKSYLDVVDIMKGLSSADVRLVCARPAASSSAAANRHLPPPAYEDAYDINEPPSTSSGKTHPPPPPPPASTDRLVKAKSEASLFPSTGAGASPSCDSFCADRMFAPDDHSAVATAALRSRSLEPLTNLAVWSVHPIHVELSKGERGLGFSVLDYQDPLHPSDIVIVVRSLVPGGAAAIDGRLVPGDRLLYVNDVELTAQATLEKAVNALKSAPKGIVRLGVAKPLSLDESVQSPIITQTERLLAKGCMSSPQPNRKWSGENQTKNRSIDITNNGGERYHLHHNRPPGDVYSREDITVGGTSPWSLPRLPPADWSLEARRRLYPEASSDHEKQNHPPQFPRHQFGYQQKQESPSNVRRPVRLTVSANTVFDDDDGESRSGGDGKPVMSKGAAFVGGSYLSMSSWSGGSSPSLSPSASPSLLRGGWAADVIQLPSHLEQTIKINKSGTDPLGVTVEAVDKAINGCLIKSMLRSGAFGKDGRVRIGDLLVRLNNENLRNVTNSQARAVLKRTNLVGTTDFNVSYIPGADADKYRDYVSKQPPPESPVPNVNRLSPKIFPKFYRDGEMPPMSPVTTVSSSGHHRNLGGPPTTAAAATMAHHQLHHRQHDQVSAASSLATFSSTAPIDYTHYPVSGDHYVQSYYENAAAAAAAAAVSEAAAAAPSSSGTVLPPSEPLLPVVAEVSAEQMTQSPPDEKEPPNRVIIGGGDSETAADSGTESNITRLVAPPPPPPPPPPAPPDSPTTSAGSIGARSKYWGEPRAVELIREPGRSLGISIVGGRVEVSKGAPGTGTTVSGIFIKSVIPQSPAGRCAQLNMGDRILSVNGVDLKEATHEQAVEVIRNAASPVRFIVQSLHSIPVHTPGSGPGSPFAKHSVSAGSSVDSGEYHQNQARGAQQQQQVVRQPSQQPSISAAADDESNKSPVVISGEEEARIPKRPVDEGGESSVVEASVVVVVEPRSDELSVVSEEQTGEDDEEDQVGQDRDREHVVRMEQEGEDASELLDTFAADQLPAPPASSVVVVGGGAQSPLNRRPSEPGCVRASKAAADRRYSTSDRPSSSVGKPTTTATITGSSTNILQSQKKPADAAAEIVHYHRSRVDSASAAMVRKADDDSESEDEFGYTQKKMNGKYGDLKGDLIMIELEKGVNGLGLSLAGHRDRSKLSVFVVGVQPDSPVAAGGKVRVGDELLEINGIVLHGRSHLNASAIIKGVQDSRVKLILLRRSDAVDDMAVNPIQYHPPMQRWTSLGPAAAASTASAAETAALSASSASSAAVIGPLAAPPSLRDGSSSSLAGLSSKALVGAAMSVDLACMLNDKRIENAPDNISKSLPPAAAAGLSARQSLASAAASPPESLSSPTPRQVTLRKGPAGFGITLTDGTTNDNVRGIFITHISPDSPCAQQEKVVKVGDQVLAVNGRPVTELNSSKVAEMIQDSGEIELTVNSHTIVPLPHSPASATKMSGTLTVNEATSAAQRKASGSASPNLSNNQIVPGAETHIEIEKAGKGLGLSIVGGTDTVLGSVVIHEVYPDGAAAKDGRLQPGDQLLDVNGQSLRDVAHETAITILRQTPSKVRLLVYRDPNLQLSLLDPTQIYNIFEVELLKKPGKGLGLSIVGRKTEPGVFISEVVRGGVADADGRLMQGDQILAVNGQDLTNAMQEQAATILKTCMGKVALKVGRWKLTSGNNPNPSFPVSKILAPSGAISPTVPAISVHQQQQQPQQQSTLANKAATLVTIEGPPAAANTTATTTPPKRASPIQQAASTSGGGGLTNGDQCTKPGPEAAAKARGATVGFRQGRSTPEPLTLKESNNPEVIVTGAGSTVTTVSSSDTASSKSSPNPAITEDGKSSVPVLDLCEEGCETVIVEMQKASDRPLGMGIGKRPRGILVTSIQPGTAAAEKLRVADRLLAVNGQVVTDQQSAVNYVKSSGPRLVLQVARPRPDSMDLATGQIRSSLTTMKQVTLQRAPEGGGFGFSIDGGASSGNGDQDSSAGGRGTSSSAPLHICSVAKNSPAASDGRMKVGDILLSVNGRSVQNATHAEAVQLIKQANPSVTLILLANPKHKRRNS